MAAIDNGSSVSVQKLNSFAHQARSPVYPTANGPVVHVVA